MTSFVTSTDGTRIAYDRIGEGPPLVLVVGSFNSRRSHRRLAEALAPDFSVFNYDRRGRGESGDKQPYAVEREIEDLDAVLREAGGAAVFGHSAGGVLTLKAALHGCPITALAMYEPPFFLDGARERPGADLAERISAFVVAGDPGAGVDLFYGECLNMPADLIVQMHETPFWPRILAVAHTLPYDAAVVGDLAPPLEGLPSLRIPVLHLTAGAEALVVGARAMAAALPNGHHLSLVGQTHDVVPSVVAPVLTEFFLTQQASLG